MKRFFHRVGQVLYVSNQIIVLGDRQRHARDIRLLKSIGSDCRDRHLARYRQNRRRIHHCCCQPRYQIGRARPAGGDANADFARSPRITISHMRRALLVPHQNMMEPVVVLGYRVVRGQYRAARIAEHDVNAFLQQAFHDDFRTC